MARKRKLPSLETLIITVFFFGIALWAVNKCNSSRSEVASRIRDFQEREEANKTTDSELPKLQNPPPQPKPDTPKVEKKPPAKPPGRTPRKLTAEEKPTATNSDGPTLYVTLDGLNVRAEPGLKGKSLTRLKLYETVTYMNQKTEWTQKINLGSEEVTDHWVKIKTGRGVTGWVFGPGVHYYKINRAEKKQ